LAILKQEYDHLDEVTSEFKHKVNVMEEEEVFYKEVITELTQELSNATSKISDLENELRDCSDSIRRLTGLARQKEEELEERTTAIELEALHL